MKYQKLRTVGLKFPKQSSFPLSETTVSVQYFCEFIRTQKFYAKSLAKWAELYYNIIVLFFALKAQNKIAAWQAEKRIWVS